MHKLDDSQQNAELRQAFLRHLPRRLDTLIRRGHRLGREGWDINALSLLFREVQTLAGACGRYGLLDLGERLFALENFLIDFVERVAIPDADQTGVFMRLIDELHVLSEQSTESEPVADPNATDGIDRSDNAYPLQLVPPVEYWKRFRDGPANDNVVPITPRAVAPVAAVAPVPVPVAPVVPAAVIEAMPVVKSIAPPQPAAPVAATPPPAPAKPAVAPAKAEPAQAHMRKVYHLSDGNALACEIDQKLELLGYELSLFESTEEILEMLGMFPPHLVVVDAPFLGDLENIGESVRAARNRANQRLSLLAMSEVGDLAVRLRAMRAGADAFLTVPVASSEVMARIGELTEAEASDPYRVLIVEDDRSQAIFAESILRKAGMTTRMMTDPLSVLDELERFHPDLILMDLYMPDCDGMELTAIIREREAFISTPIVFLSGEHNTDKHFEALNAGGDDFLSKPIRPKHLISAVTNRLRRARHLKRRTNAQNPRDPVSGLYDRAHVLDRINAKLAEEQTRHQGALVFSELDGSAALREKLGLIGFETLLGQIGAFLAAHVELHELVTRFGDASFLILSPEAAGVDLQRRGQALRDRITRESFDPGGGPSRVSLSFGVCPFDADLGDAGAMLNAAERTLTESRRPGAGNVGLYQPRQSDDAMLLEAIQAALRADSFQLLFQPIVSLQGEEEELFQSLLRLRGDGGAMHTAAEVVPAAERAGLIDDIDRWVLGRCLMVLSERGRAGRPVRIFAAQSLSAVRDPGRVAWLRQQLETRRLDGEWLTLEFRLDDKLDNATFTALADFTAEVKQLGMRVALGGIDASPLMLHVLEDIPSDFLRLAPKYTLERSAELRDEMRRLVTQAHERGKRVIAPNVEDAQSAAQLWTAGVDYIQGNFVQQAEQELSYDFRAAAS